MVVIVSNNAQSNILITFEGRTMSLETALKTTREGLAGTGAEANATGDKLAKMSESEAKTAHEARNMGEAVKVAADTVGLLGIESGESYIKLQSLRHGVTDFTASMGGLKAGLIGGIGLGAAFAGASFLHEAVVDSIAGEQATNQLQAALRKTPGAFEATNTAIEKSSTTWAKFGVSVGTLKAAVAQGVGAGIKPETIIGQPGKIADLAKALGEDVPTALGEIERGGRGAQRVISRLNLSLVEQRRTMQQLANPNMSANDRTQFLLNRVQQTAFAGQGAAGTKGAQGQIAALNASLADLKETVGTSLLPVLTDMVSTFSGMIQGANQMLSAVGGLSTFLQATWKPALIGISTIFLGLKISHSALGDFIRSRLLGDVSAASGAFAEEAVEATKAGDAIAAIPPVVRTSAEFISKLADAVKEPYIANINSVPQDKFGTSPVTTARFVQAPVTVAPVSIPVSYNTTNAFSEAQAVPISVPVRYNTDQAFNEATATPITVPVHYNTDNAFSEAQATPISVPVSYDTKAAFSEAAATPLAIPVSYDTTKAFSEARTHALSIPVTYDTKKAFSESNPRPIKIPVEYDVTKGFSEAGAHKIIVPVTAGSLNISGAEGSINRLDAYAREHPATVDVRTSGGKGVVHVTADNAIVTPVLDPKAPAEITAMRARVQAMVDAGGPLTVKVRPEWASNAASGLKAGIAGGVAIGITDAIFNGSIFKYVQGSTPATHGGGAAAALPPSIKTIPTGTQHVYVTNPGAIAGALGFGANAPHAAGGSSWVSVKGEPTVKVASGQKINIDNWSQMPKLTATTPTGTTVGAGAGSAIKFPSSLNVNAKQSGHWEMNISGSSLAQMAETIGTYALGTALSSLLVPLVGGVPGLIGKGIGAIKDIFGGGKGPPPPAQMLRIAEKSESTLANEAAAVRDRATGGGTNGLNLGPELQKSFDTAIKALSIGAPLGLVLVGAFKSGGVIKAAATGLAGTVEGAFASIIALISFPLKGLTTTNKPGQKSGPAVAAAFAGAGLDLEILGLGKAIVGKFSDGVKAGWTALTQRISALFNDLVNAIIKPINDVLSHIPGTHPIPLAGAHSSSGPVGHAGHQAIFTALPASLQPPAHVTAHRPVVHHQTTHQTVHHHKAGDTYHVTVNESKTPRETGDVVLKALSAAAQRKARHGR